MLTQESILEWFCKSGVMSADAAIAALPPKRRPVDGEKVWCEAFYTAPHGRKIEHMMFFDGGLIVTLDDGSREWRKC